MSERKEQAHWVKNLVRNPSVSFTVSDKSFDGKARVVAHDADEPLATKISDLMKAKYGWGDGMVVELTPEVMQK